MLWICSRDVFFCQKRGFDHPFKPIHCRKHLHGTLDLYIQDQPCFRNASEMLRDGNIFIHFCTRERRSCRPQMWDTLFSHGADRLFVGDIAPSETSFFHDASVGNPLWGCCSLPFGPDGQELPVFHVVGAVCPRGSPAICSSPLLSSCITQSL